MTSSAGESAVAGRLEVIVESELRGFAKKLKAKVEAAAKNVEAEVGVTPDTKGFRGKLKKQVQKASRGVEAKIGVNVDAKDLRAKVAAAAKLAGAQVTVGVDADGLVKDTTKASAEAEAAADSNPIRVPLRTKGRLWLEALREKRIAQAAVDKQPINVPLNLGGRRRGRGMRGLIRGGLLVSIASIIQPAVGALVAGVGGLTAMAGAMAPAVGTIAAIPLGLSALVQGMVGVTIAAGGTGQAIGLLNEKQKALASGAEWTTEQEKELQKALDGLAPSAAKFAERLVDLKGDFAKMRKEIAEPLFKPLAEQIKPVAEKLLPVLTKGLKGTSEAVGGVLDDTMRWMQTTRFLSNFGGVMEQNNRTIYAGGSAFRFLLDGFLEFQRAAEPFQRRMDAYMVRSAKWWRDTMRANREDGSTAAFLEKAGDRLAKVWNITKQLGGGLAGIFRAGDASGMRLLNTFERFLTRWHRWVDSAGGQQRISEWFGGVEGNFREFSRLIGDTFVALAKWGEDPKIERLLRMIRTELGPALNEFLTALSEHMGENVTRFFTELTRALNNLEPAIDIVSRLAAVLLNLVEALNSLAEASGGVGDTLIALGGLYLVYRKLARLKAVLPGGGGRGGSAARTAGRAGLLASLFGLGRKPKQDIDTAKRVGAAAEDTAKRGGRVATKLKTIGRTVGKGGMWAMLLGAGPDAVSSGMDTGRIKAALSGVEKDITSYGNATKGAVDDVYRSLVNTDVGKYADQFGVNLKRLARGIVDQGNTQFGTAAAKYVDEVMAKLESFRPDTKGGQFKSVLSSIFGGDEGLNASRIIDGLNKVKGEFDKAQSAATEAGAAARQAQQTIKDFFGSAYGGPKRPNVVPTQPKRLATLLTGGIPQNTKRKPQGPPVAAAGAAAGAKIGAPKFDTKSITAQVLKAKNAMTKALTQGKIKPIPAPKIDKKSIAYESLQAKNAMTKALGKGKIKPIPAPKLKTTETVKQANDFERKLTRKFTGLKLKPVKGPKLKTQDTIKQASTLSRTVTKKVSSIKLKPIKTPKVDGAATKKSAATTGQAVKKAFVEGGKGAKQGMQQGMTGVVSAIKTKGAQAKGQAKNVSTGVQAPFKGLNGPMNAAGSAAMAGLEAGIRSRGASAVAAARSIAAQVAAASRSALQVRSPSRVMMKIGNYVSEGFALGIVKGNRKVGKARKKMVGLIADAGWSKKERRRLTKQTNKEFRDLEKMGRRWEATAGRLERARKRQVAALVPKKKERKELTEGLVDGQKEYGSLTALSEFAGGYLTPGFAIAELTRRVADSRGFRKNLVRLRKRGLGSKAYRQLLDAGVEQGAPIAEQLLGATPKQLRQINRLQNQMAGVAKGLGKDAGKKFRAVGGVITDGMVKGLRDNKHKLARAAKDMAQSFTRQMRRSLKIKSPSRVMADIGGYTVDGMSVGMNRQSKRLLRDARNISAALASELGPNTHAKSLYGASRGAKMRTHQAATAMLAPLVGELIINGKDAGEVRDGLEEAMFALRKIRQGGVHADRVA